MICYRFLQTIVLLSLLVTFLSGIPVATVAQAMLQDALAHHSRAEEEASANVLIADNNRIRALYQV